VSSSDYVSLSCRVHSLQPHANVVLLGRRLFVGVFGDTMPMHDVYAYGMGLYTLIATVLITEFTAEKSALLFRYDRPALRQALLTALIRLSKWLCLFIVGGILLPILCGTCLDLYIILPFKRLLQGDHKLEIAIGHDWAFGIMHLKIIGRILLYFDNQYAQRIRNVLPLTSSVNIDIPRPLDKSRLATFHS
jgi:hypothetical protein